MSTMYRQAVIETVDELTENPQWLVMLHNTVKDIKSGTVYPSSYVDIFGQVYRRSMDIYDAWSFLQLHAGIKNGTLGVFQIETNETPESDKSVKHNNGVLSRLDYPFSGYFEGGLANSYDGMLGVDAPINCQVEKNGERGFIIGHSFGAIPLEVGYQAFEKTWMQLFAEQGVLARWPYQSTRITVLFKTDWFGTWPGRDNFNSFLGDAWGGFESLPIAFEDWNEELERAKEKAK